MSEDKKKFKAKGQVELLLDEVSEKDRNFDLGGRSFYFFDFDDNIIHLNTKIVLFHKRTNEEFLVPTTVYAENLSKLGIAGSEWEHYEIRDLPGSNGSFRNFREQEELYLNKQEQPLVLDMLEGLSSGDVDWRGPSWEFFKHAVNSNRPISIITARGHHPYTIKRAINILVQSQDLKLNPNYLSVYPVTHPDIRKVLGDDQGDFSVGRLKKEAIKQAVWDAFRCYEFSEKHRFGMSDDDPNNLELIKEAMVELKQKHPKNAFYVINTHKRDLIKEEVLLPGEQSSLGNKANDTSSLGQVGLFPDDDISD